MPQLEKHLSKSFDQDLAHTIDTFLSMGHQVADQVAKATRALIEADTDLAKQVVEYDAVINQLEINVDDQVSRLVMKRQPVANDLRLIMAISKGVVDLERVGDEAAKVAKMALKSAEEGSSPRGYSEVQHLSNQVRVMLLDALDAFNHMQPESALKVLQSDTAVNEEYQSASRSLLTYIMEDSRHVSKVINVLWVLRALERVGDHARNLAELTIHCASGSDVRHTNLQAIEQVVKQTTEDNDFDA